MTASNPTPTNPIVKTFEHKGLAFSIPFQMVDIDGVLTPVAFAHDIGMVLYDHPLRAADKINNVARNNIGLFKGLRTHTLGVGVDGKKRLSCAYTQKAVMILGMKVKSERGDAFVLWCADIMTALMRGETVALQQPTTPTTPLGLIAMLAKTMEEELGRQKLEIESGKSRLDELEERVNLNRMTKDEISCSSVAHRLDLFSSKGKYHATGVSQVAKDARYIQRGLARLADVESEALGTAKKFVFSKDGVVRFFEEFIKDHKHAFSIKIPLAKGRGRTITFYRTIMGDKESQLDLYDSALN